MLEELETGIRRVPLSWMGGDTVLRRGLLTKMQRRERCEGTALGESRIR